MNQLSWMLYGASFCDSFGTSLDIAAVVLAMGAAVMGVFTLISRIEKVDSLIQKRVSRLAVGLGFAFAFVLFANDFVPDRQTVLMIAASEAGERIYQTPDGREIGQALKDAILTQLKKAAN